MNIMTNTNLSSGYGPLTKSIDVDEALMLIQLGHEIPDVAAWQDEALYRLPQPSRQRRQEITHSVQKMFLQVEDGRFIQTPFVEVVIDATLPGQLKRDILFARYLRSTPLVWQAINQVLLPLLEAEAQTLVSTASRVVLPQAALDEFLQRQLRETTQGSFDRTRQHITAHLVKFGVIEAQPVPGNAIAKQFFAHFYQPDIRAFWFSIIQEFGEQSWTSRSERFICERSWTRTAFCTTNAYARFALDEAERRGLAAVDFFGNEKQFTLRGPDPWQRLLEVIHYA